MAESEDLPSFRHPIKAAYILGPEMGSLSPEIVARCDHLVRIPTDFCIFMGKKIQESEEKWDTTPC